MQKTWSIWRLRQRLRPWRRLYECTPGNPSTYTGCRSGSTQESYIVTEGKKRGSTRDVRPEAAFDRYYTVLRVHAGDAILTDNWHTNEVLDHARNNFEGYTFAMRTLEAWGAMIENDHRAYYTAGGRVWVMDLEPCEGKKARLPGTGAGKK
jgi:hypothetical protein